MRHLYLLTALLTLTLIRVSAQQTKSGVVADSLSRQPLAFATVKAGGQGKGVITGINGHFSLAIPDGAASLQVSYVGYQSATFSLADERDTLFLLPASGILGEVVIRADAEKIRSILQKTIRNKSNHNPEMYDRYNCNIYYKMKVDLVPNLDTTAKKKEPVAKSSKKNNKNNNEPPLPEPDTANLNFLRNNHVILSESYSRRSYRRPQQLQEEVIASRFSGLKKTYFTNLVTDVLPFHVYGDYISLNGRDYNNPVAKGWQQRYKFRLLDEVMTGNDTTYILSFEPKRNAVFPSLEGTVYINSNGYAISHLIAATTDSASERVIRIEQIYQLVETRWFPRELNYQVNLLRYPSPEMGISLNGHSVIDSVSFDAAHALRQRKAYTVRLGDSVDLHTEQQWQQLRPDGVTEKEQNTYKVIDSLTTKMKLEKLVYAAGKFGLGKLPLGPIDIEVNRLVAINNFEGTRLGLGLSTNNRISRYFSIGGWFGYGTKDKQWKYGGHARIFPAGDKDHWLEFAYQQNYQSSGLVQIHPELDRTGFRNWILTRVDWLKEYRATGHTQLGYWQAEAEVLQRYLRPRYEQSQFETDGKNPIDYRVREAGVGFRYAYGEKRVPLFEYYLPVSTKYPVLYLRGASGTVHNGDYRANYLRTLAAVRFTKHINRWGFDHFRLEGGMIRTADNKPLPRSLLLAGNGFRNSGTNYYAYGGFVTMKPYDFYSDRYVSFLYRHDFDKRLWNLKLSQPYISLAHNLMYGGLKTAHREANTGVAAPVKGYHESGVMINQLYQVNLFGLAYFYINGGLFYHWAPQPDWKKNSVWVVGFSTGF